MHLVSNIRIILSRKITVTLLSIVFLVGSIFLGIALVKNRQYYQGKADTISAQYYVSPTGSASGNGSLENPWDLQTALNHPAVVHPGDTIWLRGGTYTGNFISNLTGTETAPITVKQYPGEKAVLAASTGQFIFRTSAPWGIYQGFEVVGTTPGRGTIRPIGVQAYSSNTKFINLVVHDAEEGFFVSSGVDNTEVYGSIIYNNGHEDNVGWGSGIELRSADNDQQMKWFKDNIIFNQYEWGVKGYAGGEGIRGYNFEGNTIFNNSIFSFTQGGSECHPCNSCIPKTCYVQGQEVPCCSGGGGPDWGRGSMIQNFVIGGLQIADRIVIKNNYFYAGLTNEEQGNAIQLGWWQYGENGNRGNRLLLENNIAWFNSPSGYAIEQRWWNDITMRNNQFFSRQIFEDINGLGNFVSGTSNPPERLEQLQPDKFSGNKFSLSANEPNKIFVRPNQYEPGRANVTIYNFENKAQVSLDLSSVLQSDDQFEIIDVQNYGANTPLLTATYNGQPINITLPDSSSPTIAPSGGPTPLHTSRKFSVLLVRKIQRGGSPTPTPTVTPTPTPTASSTGSPNPKIGDVNGDGLVNIVDIGIIIDNYGSSPPTDPRADLNGDNLVNIIDIGIVIDHYGI